MTTLPTGNHLRAARVLLGIDQRQLAKEAKINVATLSRMESSGAKTVRGQGRSIEAVVTALDRHGVEIYPDRIQLKPKRKGR